MPESVPVGDDVEPERYAVRIAKGMHVIEEKFKLDWDLMGRLPKEDWAEYQRLTAVANNPPSREFRIMHRIYLYGFIISGALFLAVVVFILLGAQTPRAGNYDAVWALFAPLILVAVVHLAASTMGWFEARAASDNADVARRALAETVPPERATGLTGDTPTPHYPVTGDYNPGLYLARGGRPYAQWLDDTGYGDHETYEANKPD